MDLRVIRFDSRRRKKRENDKHSEDKLLLAVPLMATGARGYVKRKGEVKVDEKGRDGEERERNGSSKEWKLKSGV